MAQSSRRKKALIIGINYTHNEAWRLKGAHNDARAASRLLQEVHMFAAHEMVVMLDCDDMDESLVPTRKNIIRQLDCFVVQGDENIDYVFIYAGHTDQFMDTGPAIHLEEDGAAECIVPIDAIPLSSAIDQVDTVDLPPDKTKVIFDFELHRYMISRLGFGCRFTAFADSCHSATILNLPHYKCNRPLRHLASVDGARHTLRRLVCNPLEVTVTKVPRGARGLALAGDATSSHNARYIIMKHATSGNYALAEPAGICTGLCNIPRDESGLATPIAICISACKDTESTYEDGDGNSMLQSLIQFLMLNKAPTLEEIMNLAQENADRTFEAVRAYQHQYDDPSSFLHWVRIDDKARARRWYPQLSSTQPLDLKSGLVLC